MAADDRQTRRVLTGALLIAALVGGAILIFFLDRIVAMFRSEYSVVAVVEAAPGITTGSPVWVGGREVGAVTSVAFLPSGQDTTTRVAIAMSLPRKVQEQVRQDSRVRLTSARLVGAKAVDIIPGSPSAPVVAEGDTIRERVRITAAELTARAASVASGLDTVIAQMRTIAPQVGSRMQATRQAFVALDAAMQEAGTLRRDLADGPATRLLSDPSFAAALDRARANASAIPAAVAQMRARSGGLADVGPALQRLQTHADSLAAQLELAAAMLDAPNGSLSRFQQDSALTKALNAARAELDSLMAAVRRNPLRFVF